MHVGIKSYKNASRGFAMLEVLITILLVSFGLLGLAGLQAAGLRYNHSSYLKSIATQEAYDIAERVRSNPAGVYNGTTGAITAGCASSAGCTPNQMAANDISEWQADITSLLPGGSGTISLAGSIYTVTILWDDNANASTQTQFITTFQP